MHVAADATASSAGAARTRCSWIASATAGAAAKRSAGASPPRLALLLGRRRGAGAGRWRLGLRGLSRPRRPLGRGPLLAGLLQGLAGGLGLLLERALAARDLLELLRVLLERLGPAALVDHLLRLCADLSELHGLPFRSRCRR